MRPPTSRRTTATRFTRSWKLHDLGPAEPMVCGIQIRLRWPRCRIFAIRLAQLSDRDQLVRLREALWPKTTAEEHARELTEILEGKASCNDAAHHFGGRGE